MVKVAPSILAADFEKLEDEIIDVVLKGADYIHVDVMDGEFVNNKTPGREMLMRARQATDIVIDTHLMVKKPLEWIEEFKASDIITFHYEAADDKTREKIIEDLRNRKIKVGISIKPDTDISKIVPYLDKIDQVLIMLVEPGWGGQEMIKSCIDKVRKLREINTHIDIEVDGGITIDNVSLVKEAGANVIVAGTAIFKSEDRVKAINVIKG